MKLSISKFAAAALAVGLFSTSAQALTARAQAVRTEAAATRVRMEVEVGKTTDKGALDILFVIDNSGSMTDHQQKLLQNVGELVRAAQVSGLDIHAGVITTTVEPGSSSTNRAGWDGHLAGPVKKFASTRDGDFEAVLNENLRAAMTTNGSGVEKHFEAAQLALSEPLVSTVNQGFLRPKAALAIFVLTDADDQSPLAVDHYVGLVKSLKAGAPVSFHAAYVPPLARECSTGGEEPARRIEQALLAFGTADEAVSLCDPAFASKISKIGDAINVGSIRSVQLAIAPRISSMRISFGNMNLEAGDLRAGWVYDSAKMQILLGDKINWNSEPRGTRLLIDYLTK